MEDPSSDRQRPLTGLVGDLWRDAASLIRGEAALAKAELSEKAARAGMGLAWLAAGAAVLVAGAFFLLFTAMALLATVLPEEYAPWLAPLLIGVATVPVGLLLLARGRRSLAPGHLKPTQSARSVRKDVDVLKEHMQ